MTDAPQDPHSGTENGTPDATSNPAENSETREQTEARLNSASAAPQDAPPT
jgi:hypothetical protein